MTEALQNPLDRVIPLGARAFLGFGVLRPFRRDEKNDFANGGEEALVRARVGQVLGTNGSSDFAQGELQWNPEFGSLLYLLRHQTNPVAVQEVGKFYVVAALQRWEPCVRVRRCTVSKLADTEQTTLIIDLVYDIISVNTSGNDVVVAGISQSLSIAAG